MLAVPAKFLKLMSPEDRKSLGKMGRTPEEVTELLQEKDERKMHNLFASWLKLHNIYFLHARTDKKSTVAVGIPDFTVLHGRGDDDGNCMGFCIEFKVAGGKLSSEQKFYYGLITGNGIPYHVCNSAAEAIDIARLIL